MIVKVVPFLKPFRAFISDGHITAGSLAFVACQVAGWNKTPIRYVRGRRTYSGRVIGYSETSDFALVVSAGLKRYRVSARQIEAAK